MKYNLAADYRRSFNPIENERGGLYDRSENSGVKGIFVPHSKDINEDMYAQLS